MQTQSPMRPSFGALFGVLQAPRTHAPVEGEADPLSKLNVAQRTAVTLPLDRHAVVLAGAGTGKTTTLVERAAHLVRSGVSPDDILLCTFTRAAANEMRERLERKLGRRVPRRIGTLHGVCLSLLGGFATLGRTLLEDDLAKEQLAEMAGVVLGEWQGPPLRAGELMLQVGRLREERIEHHRLAPLVTRWRAYLDETDQLDFVLLLELALSRELPKFRHILVDEAQDLTAVQLAVLDALSSPLTVRYYVGDDDQSVYSFRGAFAGALGGLMGAGATLVRLEENYRCGEAIIDWANTLIHHNTDRFEKRLVAARGTAGAVAVEEAASPAVLAACLAAMAAEAQAAGQSFAILSRVRSLLDALPDWEGAHKKTIHEAKGLEWDVVACIGWEEKVLPHAMAEKIAEERRLAYVAVTRARERLVVFHTAERTQRQTPSRFLDELTSAPAAAPLAKQSDGDLW